MAQIFQNMGRLNSRWYAYGQRVLIHWYGYGVFVGWICRFFWPPTHRLRYHECPTGCCCKARLRFFTSWAIHHFTWKGTSLHWGRFGGVNLFVDVDVGSLSKRFKSVNRLEMFQRFLCNCKIETWEDFEGKMELLINTVCKAYIQVVFFLLGYQDIASNLLMLKPSMFSPG